MAKEKFPSGASSMASYLAQLAHGAAIGRVTIAHADGRSAAMESLGAAFPNASYLDQRRRGRVEQYELTLRVHTLDPLPDPYAVGPNPEVIEGLRQLAEDAIVRATTIMQKPSMENFAWLESMMELLATVAKRVQP